MHYIREFCDMRTAQFALEILTSIDLQKGGLNDETWDHIERSGEERLSKSILAQVRRRTGRKNFQAVSRIALEIASGQFESFWEDPKTKSKWEEDEIFRKAIGLEKYLRHVPDIEPMLRKSSARMPVRMAKPITGYTDEVIVIVRDAIIELKTIIPHEIRHAVVFENVPKNRVAQFFSLWYWLDRICNTTNDQLDKTV